MFRPSWTSVNRRGQRDRPMRITSGARKSAITLRSASWGSGCALRVDEGDVAAAAGGISRRPYRDPEGVSSSSASSIAYSVSAVDLARIASIPASIESSMPARAAVSPRIGGVPVVNAGDASGRLVARTHLERVGAAQPAPDRRRERLLEALVDVEERGRAGPAVEVLVGAADREVDLVVVEVTGTAPAVWLRSHRIERAGRRARARVIVIHVGDLGGAIGDMAERDQCDVVARASVPMLVRAAGRCAGRTRIH